MIAYDDSIMVIITTILFACIWIFGVMSPYSQLAKILLLLSGSLLIITIFIFLILIPIINLITSYKNVIEDTS